MYELGLKAIGTTGLTVDRFDFGYHMKPSMRRLHLHVISKDYYSPCLSHRYHWNAFNTEFLLKHESMLAKQTFIPRNQIIDSKRHVFTDVVEKLHGAGHIHRPSLHYIMKLLETPLQCNQCMYNPNNFSDLKLHLKQHVESDIESTTS